MQFRALPGPSGAPLPARSLPRAGEGVAQGHRALTCRSRHSRGCRRFPPRRGPRRRILGSGAPGEPAGPPPRLREGPAPPPARGGPACARWVKRATWGRRPERTGEGEGAAACSSSARSGSVPRRPPLAASRRRSPPPSPLSSPRSGAGCGSRAGKAPSEVLAKRSARLEIAPRPPGAPPPAWAPPRRGGRGGRGPAGRGSLLGSAGRSRELPGAAPTRALPLPRPHRLSAAKEPPLGAARRLRG